MDLNTLGDYKGGLSEPRSPVVHCLFPMHDARKLAVSKITSRLDFGQHTT